MARPSKQQNIEPWLKGLLGAGRRKAEDVIAAAEVAGIKERTLRRVKSALGIISEQEDEVWYWRDPAVAQPKTVRQSKAASEDKLVDEVKETQIVQVATDSPLGKGKPYDPKAPESIAIVEAFKRSQEREQQIDGVVKSADPFKLLKSADLDESKLMLDMVRNHRAELEDRSQKPKFKKAWRLIKKFEKEVVGREWSTKKEEWIEVPATQIEEEISISDSPIEGAEFVTIPDGYEDGGEDITYEAGKWDEWIDQARDRIKQLEKQERGVLAT